MTNIVKNTLIVTLTAATLLGGVQASQAAGGMNALSAIAVEENSQIEKVGFFKKGGKFTNRGVATIGVGAALVGGLIAHKSRRRPVEQHYYAPAPRYVSGNAHVNWCYSRYRSYDVRSNTFVTYGGQVRSCISPYN